MGRTGLGVYERIRQSGLSKAHVILADSVRRLLGKKLSHENIVYQLNPSAYSAGHPVQIPESFKVLRYENLDEIPKPDLSTLHPVELARIVEQADRELRAGAVMWVGYIEGVFAASQFSIRGQFLKRWFIPLQPDDIVIYGADTLNAFRGRGIHPAMIRSIIEREVDAGAYCDTNVWNVVAQRNIERAGFRRIARAPTLQ